MSGIKPNLHKLTHYPVLVRLEPFRVLFLAELMQTNDKLTRDVRHRSVVGPDLGQAALGSLNGHEQARALQSRAALQMQLHESG